ncbi:hypothetical protein AHF37_09966 [Paragonimus kellicotti]|nr:hypothetical protein AHF37_09966 [Paragonimus kellicotti]
MSHRSEESSAPYILGLHMLHRMFYAVETFVRPTKTNPTNLLPSTGFVQSCWATTVRRGK